MNNEIKEEDQLHRQFGIKFNGACWRLIEKEDRSEEENEKMVLFAMGSHLHWSLYSNYTAVNKQRGEYLIAKAQLYAGKVHEGLTMAEKCLATTLAFSTEMNDFDVAYAYQILCVAQRLVGNNEESERYYNLATEAAHQISDAEDRAYFDKDFKQDLLLKH